MGPNASLYQPRRVPEVDTLRALVPGDTDVIKVRAATRTAATNWAWTQAELIGAYQWPADRGDLLQPLDGPYPDDSPHTSLTICEFLRTHEYAGNVHMVNGNETSYVFRIRLSAPRWED
jgi:hypothetical protein